MHLPCKSGECIFLKPNTVTLTSRLTNSSLTFNFFPLQVWRDAVFSPSFSFFFLSWWCVAVLLYLRNAPPRRRWVHTVPSITASPRAPPNRGTMWSGKTAKKRKSTISTPTMSKNHSKPGHKSPIAPCHRGRLHTKLTCFPRPENAATSIHIQPPPSCWDVGHG